MIVLPIVSFPLLYAETHYRFKYFFSFLKKNEPEILADIPHRLEPDASLPVLLLVKDSHRYPVELKHVTIEMHQEGKQIYISKNDLSSHITEELWWKIISIPFNDQLSKIFGFIDVDVYFDYVVDGEHHSAKNDNYRTSSKTSLRVYRSAYPLPSLTGWVQGDVHTHSSYTDDQVEFGSPIEASVELSKAIGLSFFCVTDHSYDLDDRIDDYLINDPDIPKWKLQQKQIDAINSHHNDFAVLRGEEVSCSNHAQRNVHLLLWGTTKYFRGSGDGAEHWFHTKAEHTITDILLNKGINVAAYAGHPTEPTPFFQWLLIKRGRWKLDDMGQDGLEGLQILNGDANQAFLEGLECWSTLLLRGRKIFIASGNDAHGNFNRFKQIGIPFFTIREHERQLFGKMRTAVGSDSITEVSLLESLQIGRTVITNGPLVVFTIINEYGETAEIGEQICGSRLQLHVRGTTTEEFGAFRELKIISGRIGTENEVSSIRRRFSNIYEIDLMIDFEVHYYQTMSYVRLEGFTEYPTGGNANGFCYTNPIWIQRL
jgi:hypothetical protein